MDFMERALGFYVSSLYREGRRFIEIKSLSLWFEVIKGARKIMRVYYVLFLSTVLMVAGIFILATQSLNQYQAGGVLHWDGAMGVGLFLFFVSTLSVVWAASERRWMEAFGLQKMFEKVLRGRIPGSDGPEKGESKPADLTHDEEFRQFIDMLVEKKMKSIAKEATPTSGASSHRQSA